MGSVCCCLVHGKRFDSTLLWLLACLIVCFLAGKLLLSAGVPAATVQKTQRIILATVDHHHLEGDADGDVVVDAGGCLAAYLHPMMSPQHDSFIIMSNRHY
jgi:hypothetical protein